MNSVGRYSFLHGRSISTEAGPWFGVTFRRGRGGGHTGPAPRRDCWYRYPQASADFGPDLSAWRVRDSTAWAITDE
jgi:hypothetical protein